MLRKIRLTLAILFFVLTTLLFLDFTGTVHAWFGWMAKIQFLPALLALNVGVVVFLVLLTLVFGRIYCSVICPLGVLQDVVAWMGKKRKKNRYRYSEAMNGLRYGVLGVFVVALVAGAGSLVALLAPYSSYGRMANNLLQPLWQWGNNGLAYLAERAYLLQHHLPGRYGARILYPIFLAETDHRHLQMRELRPLRTQLQGCLYQHQGAPDRLQPLRGVHGLHRQVPQRCHPLCLSCH